jgi:hypothetical protein
MRNGLRKAIVFRVGVSLGLLVLLTQFNNCGNFADTTDFNVSSSAASCTTSNCVSATTDNLSMKVNLGGTSTQYGVAAAVKEFNLGGDCNEGGFPYNTVVWELWLNGHAVRNSGMLGMVAGNQTANSRCVNGRFMIYINLAPIAEDNVNRTGLLSGSTRAAYDLYVEVYGQNQMGGSPQRNTLKGRMRISLLAI